MILCWFLCFYMALFHVSSTQVGHTEDFKYSHCLQDDENNIECEEVPKGADNAEFISEWPPGPYAIPKSIHGCPESWKHGWEEGHLSIVWSTHQSVYTKNETSSRNDSMTGNRLTYYDVLSTRWPAFQTFTSGPFDDTKANFKFCFKRARENADDSTAREWPMGNFSIYGINKTCPKGFRRKYRNITLPAISNWFTDGFTPDIRIEQTDQAVDLQILLCSRINDDTTAKDGDEVAKYGDPNNMDLFNSYFILIKSDESDCPSFINTTVQMERILFGDRLLVHTDSSNTYLFEAFCYYRPQIGQEIIDNLLETKKTRGYRAPYAAVTDGTFTESAHTADPNIDSGQQLFQFHQGSTIIHWKLVDMGSSVAVASIDIKLSDGDVVGNGTAIRCFISEVKWSFLHFGAEDCTVIAKQEQKTLHLVFIRVKFGRYVALVNGVGNIGNLNIESLNVYTKIIDQDIQGRCNTDLGMDDGSILDFQLSASTIHEWFPVGNARPFSSGWCASPNDEDPFIMVDLLATVLVEGISIWNWKEGVDQNVHVIGSKRIQVLYGADLNNLQDYSTKEFLLDTSRPESQIMFLRPFEARYVKIKVLEGFTKGLLCLRFELHGCKKSGVPSLRCGANGEMFDTLSAIPLSVTMPLQLENITTLDQCRQRCKQRSDCSTAMIGDGDSSVCLLYGFDKLGRWSIQHNKEQNMQTSTKLCWNSTPTVAKPRTRKSGIGTNLFCHVAEVHNESVITSIGYPWSYVGDQSYKWIVNFTDNSYVKLIFTNISFHTFSENNSDCVDSLLISKFLTEDSNTARRITNRFNGYIFTIDTSESIVILTFDTCFPSVNIVERGYGFRAIATKQDIPTCFSLNSKLSWEEGRSEEFCTKKTMLITPMSFLGLPFSKTTESWELCFPRHRIELHVLKFQVECKSGDEGPSFYITDFNKNLVYCNLNVPPSRILLSTDSATIHFSSEANQYSLYTEGFVIKYNLTYDIPSVSFPLNDKRSKVHNIALGKPVVGSSQYMHNGAEFVPSGVTDGITHADMLYGSCFHSRFQQNPWILLDLEGIYKLGWIELYMRMNCCEDRHRNAEITTGLDTRRMIVTGYICGQYGPVQSLVMAGTSARYVKMEHLYVTESLNICEMKVFGTLEKEVEKTNHVLQKPEPVDGQWSTWLPWSPICFCNGTKPRRRVCNSPSPMFSGSFCEGPGTSYTECEPNANCKLQNVALKKTASQSSLYLSRGASLGLDGNWSQNTLTCFHTEKDYQPWWLVDLHEVFALHHIVIYNFITFAKGTRNIEITTGLTKCNMTSWYFKCGDSMEHTIKTIDVLGSVARFVKIQLMGIVEFLHLCEVEIFGQKYSKQTEVVSSCGDDIETVDGKWSSWSPWTTCSESCGTGSRTRNRSCSEPAPSNGGKFCVGENIHIKNCRGAGICEYCEDDFKKCYSLFPNLTNWKTAGEECWRRGLQLVSFRSTAELRYIKSLLREIRYADGQPIPRSRRVELHINASYFTHIGLRRHDDHHTGSITDVWDDNSPVTFTAWNTGEPSVGKCTRMNYRLFTEDNTWESEDCERQLAEYFVCERDIHSDKVTEVSYLPDKKNWVMMPEQKSTNEYMGKVNRTMSGKPCAPWASNRIYYEKSAWLHGAPIEDTMFPERSMVLAENYCRSPTDDGYLWCFTEAESVSSFEECDVIMPSVQSNSSKFDGYLRYNGTLNTTFSGKPCLLWSSDKYVHDYWFPGESLASVHNYCRDPWDSGYLWCYIEGTNVRWQPCIPTDPLESGLGIVYQRKSVPWNHTYNGEVCQSWDKYPVHRNQGRLTDGNAGNVEDNVCLDSLELGVYHCYNGSGKLVPCATYDTIKKSSVGATSITNDLSSKFICNDGQIIPGLKKCDRRFDCVDFSDETDCWKLYRSHQLISTSMSQFQYPEGLADSGSLFQCAFSSEWISVTAYCDGVLDCLDASDETSCTSSLPGNVSCLSDQVRCGEGDCIHISQVCNFIPDCVDGSDEHCDTTCSKDEFTCKSGQCIPANKRCDSKTDCFDGSDESLCDNCETDKAFHCDVARCIPLRLRCDKYKDCEDGTDEDECFEDDYESCDKVWQADHRASRSSGQYNFGKLQVFCDFDSVESGKIYTKVLSADITVTEVLSSDINEYFFLINDEVGKDSINLLNLVNKPGYSCTQKITQRCVSSHNAAAKIDDPTFTHHFKHCTCLTLDVNVFKAGQTESMCMNHSNTIEGAVQEFASNQTRRTFDYNEEWMYRDLTFREPRNYVIEYFVGPVVCEHEYLANGSSFTCEGDVKILPAHLECLNDVDDNGITLGCRSGSHLENCENFQCSSNTIKCPGSYCIPLKKICDGTAQCPGGQDEENCGCSAEDTEIIILYDVESDQEKFDVNMFAGQFYTPMSTIRILRYTLSQPLNTDFNITDFVLDINDTVAAPFLSVNRLQEYQYKMLAKLFLQNVIFTRNSSGRGGVIFLENSNKAKALAKQLFANISTKPPLNFSMYRVIENPDARVRNVSNVYVGVTDVLIKRWEELNTMGVSWFPDICTDSTKVLCPNAYRCSWSRNCIKLDQVCDGHSDCFHGDDEMLCNFRCPSRCRCRGYAIFCSHSNVTLDDVRHMSETTRQLDLSRNSNLRMALENTQLAFPSLARLNLSRCNIRIITTNAFHSLTNILTFDLSYNDIRTLQSNVFGHLKHIKQLLLNGNSKLSAIESGAFNGLTMIRELHLANARLKVIRKHSFAGLTLDVIDISNNSIDEIEAFAFHGASVKKILFDGNKITKFNKDIFTGVSTLKELHASAYKFCCIRPNYLDEEKCLPKKDEFSSCEDLMRLSALQTMLWLIGLTALIGNTLSIIYRLVYDRKRLQIGYGVFVTNLAGADLLMGIYLMIIAIADAVFRKRYIFMDDYWRNSAWCNVAGFLSTLSSEASVLFLCLITVDRLVIIKFPFRQIRITCKTAHALSAVTWSLSIFIAIIPFIFSDHFQDKFYTKSGVCIALPLTRDRPPGWMYSVGIFVGLNFVTFVLVAFGQIAIFMEFKKTLMEKSTNQGRKQDLTIARNLLLVVTTDFLCWFPIGVMGLMALNGHEITGDVYAWAAVFILPVNSALNPILYTLSAIFGKKKFSPSTDEQYRTEVSEYTGNRSMAIFSVSKHFSTRFTPTCRTIGDLMDAHIDLSLPDILMIVSRLATVLEVVHENSLVIGQLNVDTVCVQMQRTKITGKIKMKVRPQMSTDVEDSFNDMLHFGKVLKTLLAYRRHRESAL